MDRRMGIVGASERFVRPFLGRELPRWALYHNLEHTLETVEACGEVGAGSGLSGPDMEVVTIAAWFHDTGYTETAIGHEEKGVEIASRFLKKRRYPPERIEQVAGCIMATRILGGPTNLRESVICDADLVSLGRTSFFERNELLRQEIELREGYPLDERFWLERSIAFLNAHRYHTEYARKTFGRQLAENVLLLETKLGRDS